MIALNNNNGWGAKGAKYLLHSVLHEQTDVLNLTFISILVFILSSRKKIPVKTVALSSHGQIPFQPILNGGCGDIICAKTNCGPGM